MRKRNKGKALSTRSRSQKVALMRTMATSLFLHGKIKTTETKAKELRLFAEKMITRAKDNKMSNVRLLSGSLSTPIVKKLFDEIAPQYKSRNGGYTRITKIGIRKSDAASMVIIELIK